MLNQQCDSGELELTSSNVQLSLIHKTSLDIVCDQIKKNDNNELTEENINVLYNLFGETLFKALEILDRDSIELVTITNTQRKYFLVEDEGCYYKLYKHIPFCKCDQFKKSVDDDKIKNICSHILACELSFALGSFHSTYMENFDVQPLYELEEF